MHKIWAYISHPSSWFLIVLMLIAVGFILSANTRNNETRVLIQELNEENSIVSGVVSTDLQKSASGMSFRIKDAQINGKGCHGDIVIHSKTKRKIKRGDFLTVSGKLKISSQKNIVGSINGNIIRHKNYGDSNYFLTIRDTISKRVEDNLSEETASLGLAYLLGEKHLLDREIVKSFNESGLSHIIVASGFALSIAISAVAKVFEKHSRLATLIFSILAMIMFANFTGFTPSITRAFLMTAINDVVRYFGRAINPVRIILIVASLSLIINPNNIWEVGWQLSFTSFFGISVFAPLLMVYFYGNRKPSFVSEILITTVAAQICCLPILMYYFGSFYLSGLISNIILPPLLSITMFSVLAVGLFANTSFIEPIKTWADALLDFHLRVVDFFSSQKWLCIEMTPGDMRYLCGFIIILLLILFLKMRTHKNLSTTDMVC